MPLPPQDDRPIRPDLGRRSLIRKTPDKTLSGGPAQAPSPWGSFLASEVDLGLSCAHEADSVRDRAGDRDDRAHPRGDPLPERGAGGERRPEARLEDRGRAAAYLRGERNLRRAEVS